MESQPQQHGTRDFSLGATRARGHPFVRSGPVTWKWRFWQQRVKQLKINPCLGPLPREAQGILPRTSPTGRNTPSKMESKVLQGALLVPCPTSSQSHLLLFSKPVSGKKKKKMLSGRSRNASQGRFPTQPEEGWGSQPCTAEGTRPGGEGEPADPSHRPSRG